MKKQQEEKVKKNKYSIITIMFKQLARELRSKYQDLYVEAHPLPFAEQARLVVRRIETDERVVIDIRSGGGRTWSTKQIKQDMQYTVRAALTRKNRIPIKQCPKEYVFVLDDPEGTSGLEEWIQAIIDDWFLC